MCHEAMGSRIQKTDYVVEQKTERKLKLQTHVWFCKAGIQTAYLPQGTKSSRK